MYVCMYVCLGKETSPILRWFAGLPSPLLPKNPSEPGVSLKAPLPPCWPGGPQDSSRSLKASGAFLIFLGLCFTRNWRLRPAGFRGPDFQQGRLDALCKQTQAFSQRRQKLHCRLCGAQMLVWAGYRCPV